MTKKPKPCMDCGRLPKALPKHFCAWCVLKRAPVHVQAEAAMRRREAIPESLHRKRSEKVISESAPEGTAFCAGCQTYMPRDHFGSKATQCKGCMNAKSHERTLEKTYGISKEEYARILLLQDGKCAICGRKPTGQRRLAVDHNHQTGAVRGLLCAGEGRCNKSLLGAAHDDPRMLWNAYVYLMRPPAQGRGNDWWAFLDSQEMAEVGTTHAFITSGVKAKAKGKAEPVDKPVDKCEHGEHYLPSGSMNVPGKRGVWRYWVSTDEDADEPF